MAFVKFKENIVFTKPAEDLRSFFEQRKRWTSKVKYYNDGMTILTAISVLLFNLFIITSLLLAAFQSKFGILFFKLLLIKSIIDFPFLFFFSRFYKQSELMKWFILLQLIYPVYVLIVVFSGIFGKFNWKQRNYK